jgi:peptide/nickel transport system substrate-binding protein
MSRITVRRAAATVLAGALALVPITLAAPASPAAAEEGGTFTVGLLQDADSLNPFVGTVLEAYEMWGLMYDQLTGYAQEDLSAKPSLAESWEESPDQTTWTYQIRSGLSWSDGKPLTAEDAAYTFDRIINGTDEQTNYGGYVANITAAEATDDTTLVLTVSQPTPIMTRLAVPILPKHIWEDIPAEETLTFPNDDQPVGSGPFALVEYEPGQFLRFKANQDYWAGAPKVDEVVFRIFGNEDTMVQALRKGEIDFAEGLSANTFASLEGAEGITTVNGASTGYNQVGFNTGAATVDGEAIGDGHPAFADVRFRQALAHAIDRQTILDKVFGGFAALGTTIIPPIYANTHLDPGDQTWPFDLAKANQLLDAAGYPRGADGIRTLPDGTKPLKGVRYFARSESPTSQQTAPFIKGWFAELGIELEVSVIDPNQLTEVIGNGEYDVFDWGWGVEPDPDYMLSVFTCDQRSTRDGDALVAGLSDSFFCSEEYDALYAEQGQTTDADERDAIVRKMQEILYNDAPYVLTVYDQQLEAYRSDRWTNVQPQPIPDGPLIFQFGTYTYRNVEPIAGSGAGGTDDGGLSTGALIAIAAGAVLVLAGGGYLVARSRRQGTSGADDRE